MDEQKVRDWFAEWAAMHKDGSADKVDAETAASAMPSMIEIMLELSLVADATQKLLRSVAFLESSHPKKATHVAVTRNSYLQLFGAFSSLEAKLDEKIASPSKANDEVVNDDV